MKTLEVAVVSSQSEFCDVDANIRHFESFVESAASRGARLVCFPELALTSYTLDPTILKVAERVPGPLTDELERLTASHNVFLSVGMAEKDGDKAHITQILVGPDGYLGKYRKHHPTQGELDAGFSPGETFPTFDVDGFKLGINICYDGRHTDTIEAMNDARVDVIHHPHGNWLGLGADAEEWTRGKMVYFVPRAVRARAYILINNSAGDTPNPGRTLQFASGALVIDPLGQAIQRTRDKNRSENMLLASLVKPLSVLIPEFEMRHLGLEPDT